MLLEGVINMGGFHFACISQIPCHWEHHTLQVCQFSQVVLISILYPHLYLVLGTNSDMGTLRSWVHQVLILSTLDFSLIYMGTASLPFLALLASFFGWAAMIFYTHSVKPLASQVFRCLSVDPSPTWGWATTHYLILATSDPGMPPSLEVAFGFF